MVSPMVFDFHNNSITLFWRKKKIDLSHSTEPMEVRLAGIKENKSWVSKEDVCFLIQVRAIEVREQQEITPLGVNTSIKEYSDVFTEPKGLPTPRSHDHKIPLKPGSSPVSSNPYKCSYAQKDEIEKIVKEML